MINISAGEWMDLNGNKGFMFEYNLNMNYIIKKSEYDFKGKSKLSEMYNISF